MIAGEVTNDMNGWQLLDVSEAALSVRPFPMKKQYISGATGVAIPDATAFFGISATDVVSLATAKVYDALNSSGNHFLQFSLAAVANLILPVPIVIETGLFIQPSALFSGKFWVFYA